VSLENATRQLASPGFLADGGELGAIMRAFDWSHSPLGHPANWSLSLKTTVGMMLAAQAQIVLFWGADFVALYNDAYAPGIGDKHPRALARPAIENWGELWDDLQPLLDGVRQTGKTFAAKDRPFYIERHGYGETSYWDVSYSAVPDDDGSVGGVLCIVSDTTERVSGEARLRFLDALSKQAAKSSGADAILGVTTQMLGEHLGVSSCAYADVDGDQDGFTIRGDWAAPGARHITGHYSLADFGHKAVVELRAGRPLIISDNLQELAPAEAATFRAIGIGATLCMPFVIEGRLTALMAVHHRRPHTWTAAELTLLKEVTDRSWAHIERVRSDSAARQAVEHELEQRRHAERELQALNANLESRVSAEITERLKTEEQLRQAQKMEAVGQLTGGIAHDFNNMLAVIIGGLNLAQRKLAKGETDISRFVEGAADAAKRAATLTQRLLAFSRQQPLSPETLSLNRLVADMSDILDRALGETIHVEAVLAAGLWRVHADRAQLESAVLNLSVNARDAMPSGGKLTIETVNAHIDEKYAADYALRPGQYVLLAITDSGVGMTPEISEKAFDPFFTTKGVGKGTGLGLSQVYGFVRQSGGHVKIYSEPNVGTTVKIYLPRSIGKEEQSIDTSPPPIDDGFKRELILVVEDDERVRSVSAESLRDLGYQVMEAASPTEAIRLIQQGAEPDLLFTDVVMPDMSGSELASTLQRMRPELKVLFTTGYTRNAIVHNGVLDPGKQLLSKPFAIEDLGKKIRSILDGFS
jgi:signal transduction histidine kinase